MASDYKIEVPIGEQISGSSGSNSSNRELVGAVKKLDKTMYSTLDVIEIASSLLGDVYKMLQPLVKILSLLFMVVLLPLMPLVIELVKVIAGIITLFMKLFKGDISLWEFIVEFVKKAL